MTNNMETIHEECFKLTFDMNWHLQSVFDIEQKFNSIIGNVDINAVSVETLYVISSLGWQISMSQQKYNRAFDWMCLYLKNAQSESNDFYTICLCQKIVASLCLGQDQIACEEWNNLLNEPNNRIVIDISVTLLLHYYKVHDSEDVVPSPLSTLSLKIGRAYEKKHHLQKYVLHAQTYQDMYKYVSYLVMQE